MTPRRIVQVLEGYRFSTFDQRAVAAGIESVLAFEGVPFQKEIPLPWVPAVHFLIEGRVALQVVDSKRDTEAITALLAADEVAELIVVTYKSRLTLPDHEKPIHLARLLRGGA